MRLTPKPDFTPKIDIPSNFYLIQDTREQKPLFKPASWVINKKLDAGDYSIQGFESLVVIERKTLGDLYNCLGKDRERFEKELERLRDYKWKGLLIEGTEAKVYLRLSDYSQLHPNSVFHSLASFETTYHLHLYYAKNKIQAKWWVLSRLTKLFRYLREGKW